MTPEELKRWRVSAMNFRNQSEAAESLGYSRARYSELESGAAGEDVAQLVALACAALAAGLKPWPEGTEHEELPLEAAIRKTRPVKKRAKRPTPARSRKKQKAAGSRQSSTKAKKSRRRSAE